MLFVCLLFLITANVNVCTLPLRVYRYELFYFLCHILDLRDMIQGLPCDTEASENLKMITCFITLFPSPSLSLSLPLCLSIATFSSPEVLLTRKLDFDQIVLLILTISWVTVIIGICLEYLAPKKSAKKKKKGGGGGGGGATAGSSGESIKVKIINVHLHNYIVCMYVSLIL